MTERLSLSGTDWILAGFHGEDWRFRAAYNRDTQAKGWLPAEVPGSVHWDLLKAGEIPDPYFERNSRLAEWVHQRQWVYKRDFTVPASWDGRRLWLKFDGVDYEADFYLDGQLLGSHGSMFLPAAFEVTDRITAGQAHHLAVVLKDAPREWPQLGRTSTVQTGKARFGYWWDFATRLVHLGIWQDVWLEATGPARLGDVWVRSRLNDDLTAAEVTVSAEGAAISVELLDPQGAVVVTGAGTEVTLTVDRPQLWQPHQLGAQPLYRCRVRLMAGGTLSDEREVTFGIRHFELRQNPWPPAGAEPIGETPLPYTFTVNGQPLFIKGWNWVPVDHLYGRADLGERYEQLIAYAKDAGVNLLRVWGGGLIEKQLFYDLCDRAGILVWQEFIQSSSGTDNVPPADPAYLALLEREAAGIIPLRRNHPSLVLWCGGNELTDWEKRPATLAEPALAVLARKVAELDPDRPYLPTSPTGPIFGAPDQVAPAQRSQLHDVHGPWHYRGPVDSYLPYNSSTALFHSEFGTQGAVAKASLDRFIAPANQWPPNETNPNWVHHGAWWMQQHRVRELFGESVTSIDAYLPLSQYLQAENLRYGVESNRRRAPGCSGTIIWQLNEPWPNSHCTTAVDYYLRPKLAYYAVKRAYAPVAASLRYEGPILADGILRATAHVMSDGPFTGTLQIAVIDPAGKLWHTERHHVANQGPVAKLAFPLPAAAPDVAICVLTLSDADGTVLQTNPYLFSRAPAPIFASLRSLPQAALTARQEGDRLILKNDGPVCAFFPAIDIDDPRYYFMLSDNGPLLAPGEEASIRLTLTPRRQRADTDFPHGRPAPEGKVEVQVTGWNTPPLTLIWEE